MARFSTVLVANRGEIARRVIRAAAEHGLRSVAVFSDVDSDATHVREADAAIRIGPAPATASYLSIEAILDAARRSGADAIHPGYGFLSERAAFARAVVDAGLVFIGPSADVMDAMGRKDHARADRCARRRSGRAGGRRRGRRRPRPRRGPGRLSAAGQGGRRRRRQGHAGGPGPLRARRLGRSGEARGGRRVRRRHHARRALRRARSAHRGAGPRRRARTRCCTCTSATARSSGATRRCSRRRRRPTITAAVRDRRDIVGRRTCASRRLRERRHRRVPGRPATKRSSSR